MVKKRRQRQRWLRGAHAAQLQVSLLKGNALAAARPFFGECVVCCAAPASSQRPASQTARQPPSSQTSNPCTHAELMVEGVEARTKTGKGSSPEWPDATFTFEVSDVTANVTLMLFDDYNVDSRVPIGRVVVPLSTLLDGFKTRPKQSAWFRLYPPGVSDADAALNERFETGVAGFGGSAMVRPKQPLGFVQLELNLSLSIALPRAYMGAAPWESGAPTPQLYDAEGVPVLEPRLLKKNILRLVRTRRSMGASGEAGGPSPRVCVAVLRVLPCVASRVLPTTHAHTPMHARPPRHADRGAETADHHGLDAVAALPLADLVPHLLRRRRVGVPALGLRRIRAQRTSHKPRHGPFHA